jgi:ABC-type Fe3+/spermidine/putrescine transport system ATPase subunit
VGTPEQIYGAPDSAFVARFIGSANLIPVQVEQSGGGRTALRLPGGRRCEAASGERHFQAGARALLMVRPERLELGAAEPPPGRPALAVTCTDLVFQGPVVRCALRDADGGELVAYLEAARQDPAVRPGAGLWLSWEPGAARLLHPDGVTPAEPQNSTPTPTTPTG